jgi:hypothetical protein
MKFYAERAADRDLFEIVAVHESDLKSFGDLDLHLKSLSEKVWKGKTIPFPVWLDPTGATNDRWSIRGFPTVHLVDPEGKLVRGGSLELLEEKLKEGDPEVNRVAALLATAKDAASAKPHLEDLARRRNRFATAALLAHARKATGDALLAVLAALGASGGPDAVAFLLGESGLSSKDAAVQEAAAKALGTAKDATAKAPLLAVAGDKKAKPKVAEAAMLALAEIAPDDEGVQKALLDASRSMTVEVRAGAVTALGKLPIPAAWDRLVFLLKKDMSIAVKVRAIEALAATGKPEAKALLRTASESDRAKTVREAAAKALAAMP